MKFLIVSLLLLGSAVGQEVRYGPITKFASTGAALDTLLPPGIAHDWDMTSLSSSPVPIWTDKIQSYNWVQTTGSKQPHWSSTMGVSFDGSTWEMSLTNLTMSLGTSVPADCFLMVINFSNIPQANISICAHAQSGGTILVGTGGGTGNQWYNSQNGNMGLPGSGTIDYLYPGNVDNSGVYYVYTNGVIGANMGVNGAWGGQTVDHLGSAGNANFWKGNIMRFIHWTNVPNKGFTSTQISNIHYRFKQPPYNASP